MSEDAPIIYGILQPGPSVPDGVPYVRPTEIAGSEIDLSALRRTSPAIAKKYRRAELQPDDVLLSIVGTIGKVAIVPEALRGGNITQSSCRLRPDKDVVTSALLAWFLRSPVATAQFDQHRLGTAVPRLNIGTVRQMSMPLPPLPEQRRIVAKIDSLTGKSRRAREHLDHIPRLVEKYKQAVLAAAFRGDLTREWRAGQDGLENVDALLARVNPPQQTRGGRNATDAIKAGVAGLSINDPGTPLPEGWGWVSLRRLARQETGHTPSRSRSDYWDGGIPWIGIRDAGAHHGQLINDTAQTVSELGVANSSARILPKGTVCLSRTASVGYVTIMGRPMATSQDFATWTCTGALLPEYLMYGLMSEGENIREFGEGSTHTTIYFPEIRALHIALAPLEEQAEIIRRIEAGFAAIDRLAAEAKSARRLIDRLDQSILAKAFRGELVPQDPNDEPASVLLERIRAERAAAPRSKRSRQAS